MATSTAAPANTQKEANWFLVPTVIVITIVLLAMKSFEKGNDINDAALSTTSEQTAPIVNSATGNAPAAGNKSENGIGSNSQK